jgi:photosystem II stability/assembly factor-like uncharacterized protein
MKQKLATLLFLVLVFSTKTRAQWDLVNTGTTERINTMQFLTVNEVYCATTAGYLKSTDGGSTWTEHEILDVNTSFTIFSVVYDIHFISTSVGIAVGLDFLGNNEFIARTTDAGLTWNIVNTYSGGEYPRYLKAIKMANSSLGFAVGSNGRILKTLNGGESWTTVASGTTNDLKDITSIGSSTWIAVGDQTILRSTNSGNTWSVVSYPGTYFNSVSGDFNFLIAAGNSIFKSSNSGLSWQLSQEISNVDAKGCAVTSSTTAFAAGNGVLKTENSAANWGVQAGLMEFDFEGTGFYDATTGFVFGEDGIMYKTTVGGLSFPQVDGAITDMSNTFVNTCGGFSTISIRIRNNGLDTLETALINWSIDGIEQIPYDWVGIVLPFQTSLFINIGVGYLNSEQPFLEFELTNPNDTEDEYLGDNYYSETTLTYGISGTLTIGSVGADYDSFGSLFEDLDYEGICGPIEIVVMPGEYYALPDITSNLFSENDYSLTIRSQTGIASDVVFTHPLSYTTSLSAVSNVVFQDITFVTNNASQYDPAIEFLNGCSEIVFQGCVFQMNNNGYIIVSESGPLDSLSFVGCSFIGTSNSSVAYPIRLISPEGSSNIEIIGCTFQTVGRMFYGKYIENLNIQECLFSNIFTVSNAAFELIDSEGTCQFERNRIYYGGKAVKINNCGLQESSIIRIYNNFISSSSSAAIEIDDSYRVEIYNNNIYAEEQALIITDDSPFIPLDIHLVNNVMASDQTEYSGLIEVNSGEDIYGSEIEWNHYFSSINHNAYYTDTYLLSVNESHFPKLEDYQYYFPEDLTSIVCDPQFTSHGDLSIFPNTSNYVLNNAALPVPWITEDIDGESRIGFDIGADEWEPSNFDLGILEISPSGYMCLGDYPVELRLINFSDIPVMNVQVELFLNDISISTLNIDLLIEPGDTTLWFLIDSVYISEDESELRCVLTGVNGSMDENLYNNEKSEIIQITENSGTYIVGSGGTWDSPSAAYYNMYAEGICGPVVLLVKPGTYTSDFDIYEIPGSSEQNTITVRPYNGDSLSVKFQYTNSYYGAVGYTFFGAKHWIFERVRFNAQGPFTLIAIGSDSRNVRFEGVTFQSNDADGLYINLNGHYGCSNIVFDNCHFSGKKSNISVNFQGTQVWDNLQIINCIFPDFSTLALSLSGTRNLVVSNNSFGYPSNNGKAIVLDYTNSGALISNNVLIGGRQGSFTFNSGLLGNEERSLFCNNIVDQRMTSSPTSIICNLQSDGIDVINNTFRGRLAESGDVIIYSGGLDNQIKNNIFSLEGSGTIISLQSEQVDSGFIDNNMYFASIDDSYSVGSLIIDNFTEWKETTGLDSNSFYFEPSFVSATDLHLVDDFIADNNGSGDWLDIVSLDIDGEPRNNPPDIGADEFSAEVVYDVSCLGSSEIPSFCEGQNNVPINVVNNGNSIVQSLTIEWILNGVQNETEWSGSLNPGDTTSIEISVSGLEVDSLYSISFNVVLINGNADINIEDNIASIDNVETGMSGVYYVGYNLDFGSLGQALYALTDRGMCGPVEIHLMPGDHIGNFEIADITGSSATNTLTLTAALGGLLNTQHYCRQMKIQSLI